MAICDTDFFVRICRLTVFCGVAIALSVEAAYINPNNDSNTILHLPGAAGIPACPLKQFRCDNNKCIQLKWMCDGEDDCGDNSDEKASECSLERSCTEDEFRCNSGRCIEKEWLCDTEKDCEDGSDEDLLCDDAKKCDSDQFQCSVGVCIPDHWKCDGKGDCPDSLDEKDCHITCTSDQFACGDGLCIEDKFVCDGEADCEDGKDERDCKPVVCSAKDLLCPKENRCIPRAWACDGYKDCEDGTDEKGCVYNVKPSKKCSNTEWPCADKSACIHTSWLCDGENDCQDGSDEAPAVCSHLTCRSDQFQCKNRQCIPGHKHCDNEHDCLDSSDEEDCDDQKKSCTEEEFDCGEGMCIPLSQVCNGQPDCPGHEDEPLDKCKKNECSDHNGGCSDLCIDDPIGYHCSCHRGYHLVNNRTCEDIDECKDPGACSQICINTIGSFKCECHDGYLRDPADHAFCKAMHGSGSLLFTKRQGINRLSLDNHELTSILNDSKVATAMDYVFKTGQIFWIETSNHTIFQAPIDAGFAKRIVIGDNIENSDGLAVDWIYHHIYWTDTGKNTIEVANFDGSMRTVLIHKNMDEPRSIAVNPLEGWLFWSDWGSFARIERAGMDGSHRSIIISHNIQWPNGITLDLVRHKIYWVDAKLSLLSSANFDGSGRRTVLRSKDYLHLPHSLSVFEDTVYWTEWEKQTIFKANKFDGSGVESVIHERMLHDPMVVQVFHLYKQPQGVNYCIIANERCSHICLPAPQVNSRSPKISCSCPDGMRLDGDSTICIHDVPTTVHPPITQSKNTVNIEETVVDIEVEQTESSGLIATIFVVISSIVVFFFAGLLFIIYRHYIHKNVTSMNFENLVYKKTTTTDENYPSRKTTRLYTPPVSAPSTTNDESRIPLNTTPTELP